MKARALVEHLRGVWQVSLRRACKVIVLQKPTYDDKSRRPSQAALRKRIREIAETQVRYGYRLYVEEGLQIRNKRPKARSWRSYRRTDKRLRRRTTSRAMDFLSDQLFDGSKIRILTIVDALSKVPRRSMSVSATKVRMWSAR